MISWKFPLDLFSTLNTIKTFLNCVPSDSAIEVTASEGQQRKGGEKFSKTFKMKFPFNYHLSIVNR